MAQALEGRWVALNASVEELRGERAEALAAVVEAEREVMVWERRVQLEKEMREAVDPAYGNEQLAAARKEVARLSHAAAALARSRQALVGELAVEKREAIGTKVRGGGAACCWVPHFDTSCLLGCSCMVRKLRSDALAPSLPRRPACHRARRSGT